jgi:hypothetical protein
MFGTIYLLNFTKSSLRRDDALHSARLAVNIAHERLERFNKVMDLWFFPTERIT